MAISPPAFKDCRKMNSWYLPVIPAALAFAIIGYSLFLAYA